MGRGWGWKWTRSPGPPGGHAPTPVPRHVAVLRLADGHTIIFPSLTTVNVQAMTAGRGHHPRAAPGAVGRRREPCLPARPRARAGRAPMRLEFRHFWRLRGHGPSGISGVSRTRASEGAMPPLIVPELFALVLAAFAPCFTAPSYRVFCHLVAGWLHCPGRHTVTGVAVAAGAGVVGWRHVSAFHRFFGRGEVGAGRAGEGGLHAGAAGAAGGRAARRAGGRQPGAQGGQGHRAGLDAPRPVALVAPPPVQPLRARVGGRGPVAAAALRRHGRPARGGPPAACSGCSSAAGGATAGMRPPARAPRPAHGTRGRAPPSRPTRRSAPPSRRWPATPSPWSPAGPPRWRPGARCTSSGTAPT